jgi:hypothetical protein
MNDYPLLSVSQLRELAEAGDRQALRELMGRAKAMYPDEETVVPLVEVNPDGSPIPKVLFKVNRGLPTPPTTLPDEAAGRWGRFLGLTPTSPARNLLRACTGFLRSLPPMGYVWAFVMGAAAYVLWRTL